MTVNPPGVVEARVAAGLRAERIRHEIPVRMRMERRRFGNLRGDRRLVPIARRWARW